MARSIPLIQHPAHTIEAQVEGGALIILVRGTLNEDLNFGNFFKLVSDMQLTQGLREIAFDLSEVLRINSCGVREWILFIEKAQALKPIRFVSLNEAFLSQAIMVPNMLGKPGVPIDEFELPYYCEKCNVRELVIYKPSEIPFNGGQYSAPSATCSKCKGELEFDSIPSEYFGFLKRRG
jgi:hypothetical protein